MRSLLCALIVVTGLGVFAASAAADSATLSTAVGLPWTDANHLSPLENLLAPIASTIANRPVTTRCEGDTDWATLSRQRGFNPTVELGYVEAFFWMNTGAIASVSNFAELSPTVCLALQQFAQASTKPTKCSATVATTTTKLVAQLRRVAYRVRVSRMVNGVRTRVWVKRWKTVTAVAPKTTSTSTRGPVAPCYDATGVRRNGQDVAYWNDYNRYAMGLLALAHESVHLRGFVGGKFSNGASAGYPDAEARAQCYGMQRLPYVAEQLGASPDDALDIARYTYADIYPRYDNPATALYWSSDCKAGGALDIHLGWNIWS